MRVQDVMTTAVQTVAPATTADAAWERMAANRFHHLVVTRSGDVVGVISDSDIGGRHGASVRAGRRVSELMTEHVITVDPETTLRRAANLMRGRALGCLVVTDNGRVRGIVTVSDLLELLGRGAIQPSPISERVTLKHRAPHRKRHTSYGVW